MPVCMCTEFQTSVPSGSAFTWNSVESCHISMKCVLHFSGQWFISYPHSSPSYSLSFIPFISLLSYSCCLFVLSSFFPFLPFLYSFSYLISFLFFSHSPHVLCSFVCPNVISCPVSSFALSLSYFFILPKTCHYRMMTRKISRASVLHFTLL
jgi:hypothetical protein